MTLDGIPIPIGALAPSALVGLAVLLVLTGRLIPRRTYDDKVHEANEWRTEVRLKDQALEEALAQNKTLLTELTPTINSAVSALREAAANREAGGRP